MTTLLFRSLFTYGLSLVVPALGLMTALLSHCTVLFAQDTVDTLVTMPSEDPRPDFSPKGPFAGPLEIAQTARYMNLPRRMLLEPHVFAAPAFLALDERYVPLFDRVLRETDDPELLETAALGLARIAKGQIQDIGVSSDILMKHLESSSDIRVRFACARALIDSEASQSAEAILKLDEFADDAQRLWMEPALARWKSTTATGMWKERLKSKQATSTGVALACDGLAALNDASASELFLELVNNPLLTYEKRLAAAKALSVVNPAEARTTATAHIAGDVRARRLAAELLSNSDPTAQSTLATLCADPADGVAAAAWLALFDLNPELLLNALPTGRLHRDAEIRMAAARTMARFATSERAIWLHEMMHDRHLQVRNVAREMSFQVAEEQATLREQIISLAGDTLSGAPEKWQGIEQCLLLLGQLRAAQFSDRCVPLLEHPRNEVMVTSAWLLHLFPDDSVQEAILDRLNRTESLLSGTESLSNIPDLSEQSSYLMQYVGLMRLSRMQPFLEKNFSKSAPGGLHKRAAAMWAMGLIHENNPDPALTKSFLGRVADRSGMMPELEIVRRMSAIALGLMRAKSAAPGLLEAYRLDPQNSAIPDSARWSLGMIGEEMPDRPPGFRQLLGGWKLNPVGDF